jgi:acetyl-CoA carboxylase carboxyltransferase component
MPAPAPTLQGRAPRLSAEGLYDVLPEDHRLPYRIEDLLDRLLDEGDFLEFQPEYAPEFLCATGRLEGRTIAAIANRRGFLKTKEGPRIGGIVYTESARKVAYFVENAERRRLPLLYIQDVSGFMVGVEAETAGIIRAGAEMVESMACATVPRIVLTINHASGAGYYAMAGQGFDPTFTFSWPTARIGVMEGDSAIQAIYGPELEKLKKANRPVPDELAAKIEKTRADYEQWLDARNAAARGHCDAIIDPVETRRVLSSAFAAACANPTPEHLPVQLLNPEASHAPIS